MCMRCFKQRARGTATCTKLPTLHASNVSFGDAERSDNLFFLNTFRSLQERNDISSHLKIRFLKPSHRRIKTFEIKAIRLQSHLKMSITPTTSDGYDPATDNYYELIDIDLATSSQVIAILQKDLIYIQVGYIRYW